MVPQLQAKRQGRIASRSAPDVSWPEAGAGRTVTCPAIRKEGSSGGVRRPGSAAGEGGRRRARLRLGPPGEVQAARRPGRRQRRPWRQRDPRGGRVHVHAARLPQAAGPQGGQRPSGRGLEQERRRRRRPGRQGPERDGGPRQGRRGARRPGRHGHEVHRGGRRQGRPRQRGPRLPAAPGTGVRTD